MHVASVYAELRDVVVVILRKQLVKMPLISASMDFLRAAACQMIRVVFVGTRDRLRLWSLFDVARGVHVASVYAELRDVVVVILRKQLVKMPLISASMDFLRAAACQMIRVAFVGTRDRLQLWSLFDVARGVHVASVYAELRDVVVVILRKQLVKMPLISASMDFLRAAACQMIRVAFVGTRDRLRLWSLFQVARGVHVASVYAELRDVVVVILRKQLVKMPLISASMDFLRAAACQMIRVAFVGTRDRLQLWSLFDVARGVHVASVYAELRDVVVATLRKQLVKMPLIPASMDFPRTATCRVASWV